MIDFRVYGQPRPQGSKNIYRGRLVESAKGLKEWREAVATEAAKQSFYTEQPVELLVHFYLERPKTVKRAKPSVKPDLDKLLRSIGDSISGVLIKDDAQIVIMSAKKEYGEPGAWIQLVETF